VRLVEKGNDPRLSTLRRMAAAMGVRLAELCDPEAR
jgi:hypothetical protein